VDQSAAGAAVIEVGDTLDGKAAAAVVQSVAARLADKPGRVVLDLSQVQNFDSAGMGGVVEAMRRGRRQDTEVKLKGASASMLEFLSLVSVERLLDERPRRARVDVVSRVGAAVEPMLLAVGAVLGTAAGAARDLVVHPIQRRALRLDRISEEVEHAALGALPIVSLIAFLLGLILAMQAYVQLRVWGAEIYMADMVGVSVITEIGPLMTAIILAARSGSSNAAQLGAMVVSEEIDALKQMGVHAGRYLVIPKVIALAFAAVALGLLFDVVAVCGGALFAMLKADIELGAYREQTRQALHAADVLVAIVKSATFGVTIGVVGCSLGLRVTGGSVGVARATTNAVVVSIFLIIIVDALFVTVQRLALG
jgi:phospholipid/cholesterol/gamma-HCH transport system permease protein